MNAESTAAPVAGIVLAAGGGSRFGMPKALARDPDGTSWLARTVCALECAGCSPVFVVLGADADAAADLLAVEASRFRRPWNVRPVVARRWSDGVAESVRAGIRAVAEFEPDRGPEQDREPDQGRGPDQDQVPVSVPVPVPVAVVIVPVDVPDVSVDMVERVAAGATASSLRQAQFDGRPGHPVLIGRDHWGALGSALSGDTGARPYLRAHNAELVECGDLGTGVDVDRR